MTAASAHIPAGPRGLPVVGNLFQLTRAPLMEIFAGWQRQYGDVVRFRIGSSECLLLSDPDAVEHVLVRNQKNYRKSRNYALLEVLVGKGLLTSDGDFWKRQRQLIQPAFGRQRLQSFVPQMVGATEGMLARWPAAAGQGLDMVPEMTGITLEIVARTLFGTSVEDRRDEIRDATSAALHYVHSPASRLGLPMWLPLPITRRFLDGRQFLESLVERIIGDRRAAPREDDALDLMMHGKDEDSGQPMSDRQLRDELLTLLLAGYETTANALTWTLYLLTQHTDVARAVHEEVARVLGGRDPGDEDLARLQLTEQVISEAMRLYPPIWSFDRRAVDEDEIQGYRVPRDATVFLCPYTLHRHPAHWSEPDTFSPERFAPGGDASRHRYAFIPFGAGARTCIGRHFAMMEAKVVIAMILARYQIALVPGQNIAFDPMSSSLRPREGIRLALRPH